jgi:hypothetical protein
MNISSTIIYLILYFNQCFSARFTQINGRPFPASKTVGFFPFIILCFFFLTFVDVRESANFEFQNRNPGIMFEHNHFVNHPCSPAMNLDEDPSAIAELEAVAVELVRKLGLDVGRKAQFLDSLTKTLDAMRNMLSHINLEWLRHEPPAKTTEAITTRLVCCTYSGTFAAVYVGWVLLSVVIVGMSIWMATPEPQVKDASANGARKWMESVLETALPRLPGIPVF